VSTLLDRAANIGGWVKTKRVTEFFKWNTLARQKDGKQVGDKGSLDGAGSGGAGVSV